jgi:hypothetical protein
MICERLREWGGLQRSAYLVYAQSIKSFMVET